MKKFLPFILGLVLSVSLLWPMFAAPYFSHHDDLQVVRLHQMDRCFSDLQIPCRWVPDLGGGYGYPLFNYYAPLPYYIGEIFYLLTGSLIWGAKLMFIASFIGAYIFMFLLGRKLWGEWGGLLSGVFYSFAPYHAVDLYVRGAMGEMWGLVFFPAIFWAVLKIDKKIKISNILLLGFFIFLLILSHNLSALIFLPITFIFVLFLTRLKNNINLIYTFILSSVLAVALASFYLLPVIFEKNLVHVDTTTYGYFSYTEHFKGLRKTLFSNFWGWGASVREVPGGAKDDMSFQVGYIHLVGIILSLLAAKFFWKSNREKSLLIIFATLIVALSIFMIHPRSLSIWQLIDPLKYLQFPWRFLMLVIFFISLAVGSLLLITNQNMKKTVVTLLAILVVVFNFNFFVPEKFKFVTEEELLTGREWEIAVKRSIFDYLPIYAEAPPADLATSKYEIQGQAEVTKYEQGTDWINLEVKADILSLVTLSQYYFPGWEITIDNKKININYINKLGLMSFLVDPGVHKIEARLMDTQVRSIGNIISLFSMTAFFMLLILQVKGVRKYFTYLTKGLNK